jgi:hypothetical protein
MKKILLLIFVLSSLFLSCKTKEGEPGPAGDNALNKDGSISGTIYYNYANGDTAIVPFNYEYYESELDFYAELDTLYDTYKIRFKRRELKEINSYTFIELYGALDANNKPLDADFNDISFQQFNLVKKINNKLFKFAFYNLYSSTGSITDFVFDEKTGKLFYNYTFDVSPSDISSNYAVDGVTTAKIVGNVNLTLPVTIVDNSFQPVF